MDAQIKHYENKLSFEMDPSDLFDAFNNGEKVIALDARKPFGFEAEHTPNGCVKEGMNQCLRIMRKLPHIEPSIRLGGSLFLVCNLT